MDDINKIIELLPLLIPLIIAELAVLGYTLYHIFTHSSYKRGNRVLKTAFARGGREESLTWQEKRSLCIV